MQSKCPICKKLSVFEFRPFCSKRCANVDLAHWLRGDYCIEGEEGKKEEGPEPENPSDD